MFSTFSCLLFLLSPSFLGAEKKPGCKMMITEEIKCHADRMELGTPGCEADCKAMTVEDCKDEEPEECTTELDTVCDDMETAGRDKISPAPAMKVKAALAKAGIATDIVGAKHLSSGEMVDGVHRMKRSLLPGRLPFPNPFTLPLLAGAGFGALGGGGGGGALLAGFPLLLPKLKFVKLLKLKLLLKKAGIAAAIAIPLALKKKKKKGEEETCFEIPRTVCEAPHYKKPEMHYKQPEPMHYSKREAETPYSQPTVHRSNCHTTVQTVCGANAGEEHYRKKRSVAEGCRVVPVSQHCMKKEPRRVCRKVEKQVCSELPETCYKEIEVCEPEKVMKEICS